MGEGMVDMERLCSALISAEKRAAPVQNQDKHEGLLP